MGKWISVKERLPEERKEIITIYDSEGLSADWEVYKQSVSVVVTVKDNKNDVIFVSKDYTVDGKWHNFNGIFEVIAWQPLPGPYNAESEEGQ